MMWMKTPRLMQVLDDPMIGIFAALQDLTGDAEVPWHDLAISDELDMVYMGNHSGAKRVSPLVNLLLEDGMLSDASLAKLASSLQHMFGTRWSKEWDTMLLEYDPISNYDMEERETPAQTTETNTPAETTRTRTPSEEKVTNARVDGIFGFNSSADAPSPAGAGDGTSQNEVIADEVITETVDAAETRVLTVDEERVLTRRGNVGVTTSQQMVEAERNLWNWNFFFDVVFPDVDKLLCSMIY